MLATRRLLEKPGLETCLQALAVYRSDRCGHLGFAPENIYDVKKGNSWLWPWDVEKTLRSVTKSQIQAEVTEGSETLSARGYATSDRCYNTRSMAVYLVHFIMYIANQI